MSWEEFKRMLELCLMFQKLDDQQKQAILLMMDGLKYRRSLEEKDTCPAPTLTQNETGALE